MLAYKKGESKDWNDDQLLKFKTVIVKLTFFKNKFIPRD